jgi:hypothetical protein
MGALCQKLCLVYTLIELQEADRLICHMNAILSAKSRTIILYF